MTANLQGEPTLNLLEPVPKNWPLERIQLSLKRFIELLSYLAQGIASIMRAVRAHPTMRM